jgi:hypothetical protein
MSWGVSLILNWTTKTGHYCMKHGQAQVGEVVGVRLRGHMRDVLLYHLHVGLRRVSHAVT